MDFFDKKMYFATNGKSIFEKNGDYSKTKQNFRFSKKSNFLNYNNETLPFKIKNDKDTLFIKIVE